MQVFAYSLMLSRSALGVLEGGAVGRAESRPGVSATELFWNLVCASCAIHNAAAADSQKGHDPIQTACNNRVCLSNDEASSCNVRSSLYVVAFVELVSPCLGSGTGCPVWSHKIFIQVGNLNNLLPYGWTGNEMAGPMCSLICPQNAAGQQHSPIHLGVQSIPEGISA